MKKTNVLIIAVSIVIVSSMACFATPSTQIWNPSTDIQAAGTTHLGIDNYWTVAGANDNGYGVPVVYGLEYGVNSNLEVGVDAWTPVALGGGSNNTLYTVNAKYGVVENDGMPAYALGAMNFGFNIDGDKRPIDQSLWYALAAKTFSFGRLTGGYYTGNDHVLLNNNGDKANTGFIATWDKAITDKLWACVDYASGYSAYGSTFYGVSWGFSSNTSVIFGYGTYNNGARPTVTTQLDINI
jgi:hypothetical protein